MAKYCSNCGSVLPEDGICQCQKQAAPVEQAQQPQGQPGQVGQPEQTEQPVVHHYSPNQAPPPQYQPVQYPPQNFQPSAAGIYFKKMWKLFVEMIKAPVTAGTQFVSSCDYKVAFGFIGAEALAMALFMVVLAAKLRLAAFSAFFVGAVVTFGMACLLPAVLVAFVSMFGGKTNYKYMLCVSGIKSLVAIPFNLLSFLILLIMPIANVFQFAFNPLTFVYFGAPLAGGNLLANFIALKVIKGGAKIKEDYTVYVMACTAIVMSVALYIAFRIFSPMLVPRINVYDFNWNDLF